MKLVLALLIAACATCLVYAVEPVASVESLELGPIPEAIRLAIESDASFNVFETLHCKMKGKTIPLSLGNSIPTWFVTTSDACGWGAAVGPIWLVKSPSASNTSLLLATGGNSLSISKKSNKGFAGVVIISGTAEENVRNRYFFNGKKYVIGNGR